MGVRTLLSIGQFFGAKMFICSTFFSFYHLWQKFPDFLILIMLMVMMMRMVMVMMRMVVVMMMLRKCVSVHIVPSCHPTNLAYSIPPDPHCAHFHHW